METATAFNKSVKCRKKRKCVVCRRGGGGDDRSGLRDKCHQFLPQFVSRPSPASPAAALPLAGIFSHHVGSWSQCWSWTALGFNCPQRRVSIGGLDTGQWSPVLQSHGGSSLPPCYHQDTGRLRRIRVKGRESASCSLLCYEQGQVSVLPVPCPQYEQVRGP